MTSIVGEKTNVDFNTSKSVCNHAICIERRGDLSSIQNEKMRVENGTS